MPNSGAKKNRRDVEVDFVEDPGVQALLDGVGAVDSNGLPGGGGFGLVHGAFDAVGHEVDRRVGARPAGGDVVGQDECGSPSVISAPALGDVESASPGEHSPKFGCESAKVLGARPQAAGARGGPSSTRGRYSTSRVRPSKMRWSIMSSATSG